MESPPEEEIVEVIKHPDHVERMLTDIIEKIGYKNKWHMMILLGVCIVTIQDGGNMIWSVFGAAHIPHRCLIPGLDSPPFANISPSVIHEVFYNDPRSFGCNGIPADRQTGCTALNINTSALLQEASSLNVSIEHLITHPNQSELLMTSEYGLCSEMSGFEFMPMEVEDSAAKEFGLVCGREIYRRVDKALFVLGQAVGAFVLGYLSDKYGRKKMLIVQYILELFCILALALSPHIVIFLFLRFVVSMFNMSKFPIAVTFGAEVMMPQHRGLIGMIPGIEIGVGMILYSFFAYLITSWRWYTTTGMWFCLPITAYWLIAMPESPRWLLEKGRYREFQEIVKNIERKTGKTLDPKMWYKLEVLIKAEKRNTTVKEQFQNVFRSKSSAMSDAEEEEEDDQPSGFQEIGRSPLLIRWLTVFAFVWCANTLLYYALTMGQDLFNLNLYSYTLINGCFEMAGVLLIMFSINWIGRRASMMGGLFLCGVSLALCQVFEQNVVLKQLFASTSKLFITGTFDMAFLYTGEVMPTLARTTGVGICSCICRVVGMGFPFIEMINSYIPGGSIIFMVVLAAMGAGACFLLPETKGQELPETIEDCELLANRKLLKFHPKVADTEPEKEGIEIQLVHEKKDTNC